MQRRFKNQRGIALLMVIAFVTMMSTVVIDFLAQSLVNHQIAINAEKRLQAFYLAKSALNFSELLLYYSKTLKSQIDKTGLDESAISALGYQPLYKMFPLSSNMIRGLVSQGASSEEGEEEGAEGEEGSSGALLGGESLMSDESLLSKGTGFDKSKAEEFLSFKGDFESEIFEEASKYSLNAVSKMTATDASYDLYKKVLLQMLLSPEYKNFFDNQEQDAEDLVHALADWVDTNQSINEFDQVERGQEGSVYRDADYEVKNAKFLTLSEARLIQGMSDDIFTKLEPFVTVYHTSSSVNVCLSESSTLDALIVHYTKYGECTNAIDEDDTETLTEMRDEVLANCPDKSAMASALNVKLGLKTEEETAAAETSGTSETKQTSSKVAACKIQFEDLITDSNDVFQIKAKGVVGNVQRTITVVKDTSASSPDSWKTLYYQVQ